MLVDDSNATIESAENEISINKKIQIEIGLKNPFKDYVETYGEIIWFPQGTFVLSSVNSSRSTSGWTLSITAKDKMCLLDGTAGGTFPASAVLHERYIELADGSIEIEYPLIRQIIFEAVNHYGGEDGSRIFINDLSDTVKMLVKYDGFTTIYRIGNSESKQCNFSFKQQSGSVPVPPGEDAGYEMTDFTYPGELILNAGETVVSLLDKVVKVLGNYEYYYDINGNFIFQEIKNYINTQSPLEELNLLNLPAQDYLRVYDNAKTIFSLTDLDTAAAITHTPKYDNIKNDFYVWGQKSENLAIRYHLAIDVKPEPDFAMQYMWPVYNSNQEVIDYYFTSTSTKPTVSGYTIGNAEPPCSSYEWREELYRQALYAKTKAGFESGNNYYYEELLTEWRNQYDPSQGGWIVDVANHPEDLTFWLDFIDSESEIGKYSVREIGRRTKLVNNTNIKTIYNKEVPDVVFIPADSENKNELITEYTANGQTWCVLNSQLWDMFSISSTGASCFDEIRDLMYKHLNYNTTIQITCLPIYYLEPNNLIYIEDVKSGIIGSFQITQFSLPLTYNGTMSISATEVFTKV